jgi:hypothetical protein
VAAAAVGPQAHEARTQQDNAVLQLQDSQQQCHHLHQRLEQLQQLLDEQQVWNPHAQNIRSISTMPLWLSF